MNSPFLVGRQIYLRPHFPSDLETNWYQWFNDPEVTEFMYQGVFPNTPQGQATFFEDIMKAEQSKSRLQLAIIHKETDSFIGIVSLGNIDWVNRSAEIAIVIGEKKLRGRRNGLEAMALLIHHGFSKMNLNRIWAGQHIGLRRWREALEANLGFRLEGTMRQAVFTHGSYYDVVIISVLAEDWFKLLGQKPLTLTDFFGRLEQPSIQRV